MSHATETDNKQAQEFLGALGHRHTPEATTIFCSIHDTNKGTGAWHDLRASKILSKLAAANKQGRGVFVAIGEYAPHYTDKGTLTRKDGDMIRPTAMFVDEDNTAHPPTQEQLAARERFQAICPPTMVVETSPGNYHKYWVLDALEPDHWGAHRVLQAMAAELMGTDPVVKDPARVMRLPGYLHQKNPDAPFLVTLTHCDTTIAYSQESLYQSLCECGATEPVTPTTVVREGVSDIYESKPGTAKVSPDKHPPAPKTWAFIHEVLLEYALTPVGSRNDALLKIARRLTWTQDHPQVKNKGIDMLRELAMNQSPTPPQAEVDSTINRGVAYGRQAIADGTYAEYLPTNIVASMNRTGVQADHHLGGGKTRYDLSTSEYLYQGNPHSANELALLLSQFTDEDPSDRAMKAFVDKVHRDHSFHPFTEYVLGLTPIEQVPWEDVAGFTRMVFGVSDALSVAYLRCFLMGLVGRQQRPGMKHDTCLILKGRQGSGKTSFLRELVGEDYQVTLTGHEDSKQRNLSLLKGVIIELGELEADYSNKALQQLKNELTDPYVSDRPLYTNTLLKTPKRCAYAGTTNNTDFLTDKSGNRRFHVVEIPDGHDIPWEWVGENRDLILSWALGMWLRGTPSILTKAEQMSQTHHNERFLTTSAVGEQTELLIAAARATYGQHACFLSSQVQRTVLGTFAGSPIQVRGITDAFTLGGYERRQVKRLGTTTKVYIHLDADPKQARLITQSELDHLAEAPRAGLFPTNSSDF